MPVNPSFYRHGLWRSVPALVKELVIDLPQRVCKDRGLQDSAKRSYS